MDLGLDQSNESMVGAMYDAWSTANKVARWVKNAHPESVTRSHAMRKFRLAKEKMFEIEEILMTASSVVVTPFPNPTERVGTTITYSLGEGELFKLFGDGEESEDDDDGIPSVYFALAPSINRMKIGWTRGNPVNRVSAINGNSPVEVFIFGAIKGEGELLERTLHRKFNKFLVKGREWFTASEIVKDVILLPGFNVEVIEVSKLTGVPDTHWTPEAWKKT